MNQIISVFISLILFFQSIAHASLPLASATLEGLSGKGATISAGNDVTLIAENNIENSGAITAGNNVTLAAGGNIANTGLITAGNNISLTAANDITNAATIYSFASGTSFIRESVTAQGQITSGNNINLTAGNDVAFLASIATAAGGVNINAGNDVTIASEALRNRRESGLGTNHSSIDDVITHVSSELNAGAGISITSANNTIIQASNLTAGDNVDITAGNQLALLTTTDSEFHQKKDSSESLMWQSSSDVGSYKETIAATTISAQNVNIIAANGIIAQIEKKGGTVADSVAVLSQQPGMEYLAQLQNNPDVNWQQVDAVYKSWNYEQSGLTPAGAAIIAIAVAAATAGTGLAGSVGTFAATSAGATGATGVAVSAAAAGSFTALTSQAAVSLVNNKGDIGKVMKELATEETAKNLAFAAVTAGATAGLGNEIINSALGTAPITPQTFMAASQATQAVTNAAIGATAQNLIYGQDFGKSFTTNLIANATYAVAQNAASYVGTSYHTEEFNAALKGETVSLGTEALHIGAHAAIGCAAGAATNGGCGNGAIGGAVGELGAQLAQSYLGINQATSAGIGHSLAVGTALVTGADATGIYTASGAATNAIQNNFLLPQDKKILEKELENCGNNQACKDNINNTFSKLSSVRNMDALISLGECVGGDCSNLKDLHVSERIKLTEDGYPFYTDSSTGFIGLKESQKIYHDYETDPTTGSVINLFNGAVDNNKYIHVYGYEVVTDSNNNIVTSPLNMGSYNYYNPQIDGVNDPYASTVGHFIFDMVPYYISGNSSQDPTTVSERLGRLYMLKNTIPKDMEQK